VPLRSGRRARVGGLMRVPEPRSSNGGERLVAQRPQGMVRPPGDLAATDRAARFRRGGRRLGGSLGRRCPSPSTPVTGSHTVVAVLAQHQDRALVVLNYTLVELMSPLGCMDMLNAPFAKVDRRITASETTSCASARRPSSPAAYRRPVRRVARIPATTARRAAGFPVQMRMK
jgi:hypothetical protein